MKKKSNEEIAFSLELPEIVHARKNEKERKRKNEEKERKRKKQRERKKEKRRLTNKTR
jgi:hypothetical protein